MRIYRVREMNAITSAGFLVFASSEWEAKEFCQQVFNKHSSFLDAEVVSLTELAVAERMLQEAEKTSG